MNDLEWAHGMAELRKAGLPGWPEDPEESAARAEVYRRHLDDLPGAAWLAAVGEAIQHERWFPTVAALRDYAAAWEPPLRSLPALPRTPEQLEADREETRRGLERVRAAYRERAKTLPTPPAPIQASVNGRVHWDPERVAMLREQARQLREES